LSAVVDGWTVSVDFATADGSATAGADYQAQSSTLTFAPGETNRTIAIDVIGDTLVEGDEIFTVTLSGAVNAVIVDGEGVGTILNDDTNAPPVAVDDAYGTSVDVTLEVSTGDEGVLANDTDADGDALSAVLVDGPNYGVLTLNGDGTFTYVPNPGFVGVDGFTYRANDGQRIGTGDITVNMNLGSDFSFDLFGVRNLNLLDFTDNGVNDGLVRINGGLNLSRTKGVTSVRVTGVPELTFSTMIMQVQTSSGSMSAVDSGDEQSTSIGATEASGTLETSRTIMLEPVETPYGGSLTSLGTVQMASVTAYFPYTNFLRADTTEVDETKPFMYISGLLETQVDALTIASNGAMDVDVNVPQLGPDSLYIADASLEVKTQRFGSNAASFSFTVDAGRLHLPL
ncbi:hypothetical protein LCGC14_2845610, partial [marine sediment metagenome]